LEIKKPNTIIVRCSYYWAIEPTAEKWKQLRLHSQTRGLSWFFCLMVGYTALHFCLRTQSFRT